MGITTSLKAMHHGQKEGVSPINDCIKISRQGLDCESNTKTIRDSSRQLLTIASIVLSIQLS
ncbi:MAG: hypothetical protein F6K44_22325 [Moorea sp. SIO3E2]|nr:hypothetical protein [Moorena sp. SIO3E2]